MIPLAVSYLAISVPRCNCNKVNACEATRYKNVKFFSIQRSSISDRLSHFGRFPGFTRLSFWKEQHVDEDECGALVE
jgi:hypothetical protein